ncbi:hypothetical protein COV93_00720 [Candidatus Woesearchaeota archaeon CG11_big_fil_rev_8_21_14_0_20_43_8]|nr:MAG: hypothetical protein COV93_00720 [Candidatus Woesearchaeota archaeon CG11_big_fil_rev_8_21_14_0_20_43_8]
MKMVAKKCLKSGNDPDITKMFNRAKKLHKRWNEDLFPLIKDDVTFQEVMQTLAKRFDLKEEKDKKKDP